MSADDHTALESAVEYLILPVSKPMRVWFEVVRTVASCLQVCLTVAILLKVFSIL